MEATKRKKAKKKPVTPAHAVAQGYQDAMEAEVEKRDFTADERRRLASEGKALPNGSYPIEDETDLHNAAHLAASGHGDVKGARRLIARRAKELGVANPMDSHKADSTGNPYEYRHPRGIAAGHPDLRQSNTDFSSVLANMHTARGNVVDLHLSDSTPGGFSHAGEVALRHFDAANQAGRYTMPKPSGNPERPDYSQHRNSATPPNGSHSLGDVQSHAVHKSALEIMKETQRRIG